MGASKYMLEGERSGSGVRLRIFMGKEIGVCEMMKKNWAKVALLLAVAIVMSAFAGFALAETYVKTTGNVNVRAGAGLEYRSLGTAKKGAKLTYLEATGTDSRGVIWYKVKLNSKTNGWVSSKYASLCEGGEVSFTQVVEVTAKAVNLRAEPNGRKVDVLKKGDTAIYLNQSKTDSNGVKWYNVRSGGGPAWICAKYVKLRDASSGSSSSEASKVVVTAKSVFVRSEPSLSGRKVGTLYKGDAVKYAGQSHKDSRGVVWYRVNNGWVSSRYTKLK